MQPTIIMKNQCADTDFKTLVNNSGMKLILSAIIILLLSSTSFAQTTYSLDKNHAKVGFSAVHFGISDIEGNFKIIDATLNSKKSDFTDAEITFTADVNSINTDVAFRDSDLKSENYFNAGKYPSIYFTSTSFKKLNSKNYRLLGNITIHGITKPVVFNVIYNGQAITAMKKNTAGFTINGMINRLDFGVGGSVITSGISNSITLRSNVEFTITE